MNAVLQASHEGYPPSLEAQRGKLYKKLGYKECGTFKPLQESDLNLLCHWFREPHVKEWWNDHLSDEEIKSKYEKRIGDTIVAPFIAYLNAIPIWVHSILPSR